MHRIFRTANFKLIFLYASIFSISVFILGLVVFYSIRASIHQHLRTQIELDAIQLMGDYRDDGIDELRHDIRERIEANPANRLLYFIQSPDGRVIFDKIPSIPDPGWHYFVTEDGRHLLLHSIEMEEGYRFAIASDMERALSIQNTVRNIFAIAFFLSLALGVVGGIIVSRRFLARVDGFKRTVEDIGRQEKLTRRLPLSGSDDDFDQIAAIVNGLLEKIENLMREVRKVTTNIAHDLRTPLGTIRQRLEEMMVYPERRVEDKKNLEEMMILLDKTLETFSALLRIAEIESGSRRSEFVQINLSQILQNLTNNYRPVAEEHGYQMECLCQASAKILGDERLLTQLFVNLIENAIRHAGGDQIRLHLYEENKQVIAAVEDKGKGVPSSEKENILKPFYRLDPSRNSPGNGLGLSLVAAIAELHQAKLAFEDNSPGLKVLLVFSSLAPRK